MAEPIVRSYDPTGELRWEAVLPAYPQEIALGPLGEVYVIADDVLKGNGQVVSLTAAGAPGWSLPLPGGQPRRMRASSTTLSGLSSSLIRGTLTSATMISPTSVWTER